MSSSALANNRQGETARTTRRRRGYGEPSFSVPASSFPPACSRLLPKILSKASTAKEMILTVLWSISFPTVGLGDPPHISRAAGLMSPLQISLDDGCIPPDHLQACMSKQPLEGKEIAPIPEELGSKSMPQPVRMKVRDSRPLTQTLEQLVQ